MCLVLVWNTNSTELTVQCSWLLRLAVNVECTHITDANPFAYNLAIV